MATSPKRTYIRFFTILILLVLLLLLIRLAFLTLTDLTPTKTYEDPPVAQDVVRGTIFDRNGRILAIQTPYWGLYFHLQAIKDLQLASEVVAPYVGMSPEQIIKQSQKYTTYAQIKARIDEDKIDELRQAILRNDLGQQVTIEKRLGRSYPAQFHASQTIGFVNTEGVGIEGIEAAWEQYLNPYPEVGLSTTTYGQNLYLTLDMDIQYALDVQLQSIAGEHNPDYAAAIVLDAQSGDILGMSSYPWYDINALGKSTDTQRMNHAVNQLYEPGSVFKLFSLAAVMQSGEADLSEPFECDGTYTFKVGNSSVTINCTEPHGTITPQTMIQKSCNGAIVHWAMQTDPQLFYDYLSRLGFNSSYDIGLPSRAKSQINPPSLWSGRSEATISFGQEMSTTALHLATAATALCNEGQVLQPNLILSRTSEADGKVLYERQRKVLDTVLDKEVTLTIREGMKKASLTGGTGIKAAVDGIQVGIKTGTAQILNPETNSYEDGTVLASSLAIVPIDNPRYIIYFAAGNPKGNTIWGSNIAAPAIANVIKMLVSQGKLVSSKSKVQ